MVSQQFSQMRSVVIKLTFGVVINVAISCVNEVDAQQDYFHNRNSNRSRNPIPQWQQDYDLEIFSNTNSHWDQSQPQSQPQSGSRWGHQDQRHERGPGRTQRQPQSHSHRHRQPPQNSRRGRCDFDPHPRFSSGSDSEQTYYPQSSSTSAPSSGANNWGQQDERERHRSSQHMRGSPPLTSSSTSTYQPPQSMSEQPPAHTLGDYDKQRLHWIHTFRYGRKHHQHSRWARPFPKYTETQRRGKVWHSPRGWPFSGETHYNKFIVEHWMDDVLPVFEEETRNLDKEEQYLLYRFLREVVYQYNLGDSDRRNYMDTEYITSEEDDKERNRKNKKRVSASRKSKRNNHKQTHYWGKVIVDQRDPVNLKELERARLYPSYFQEFLVEKILRNHGFATQNVHESCVDFRILGMQYNEENPSKKDHSQSGSLFAKLQVNLATPWQVEVKSQITEKVSIKCGGDDNTQALNLCKRRNGMEQRVERSFLQHVVKCEKKVRFYDQQHVDVVEGQHDSVFHFKNQREKHHEQNPTYVEFSYPDKKTMPSLPKILGILETIVNKLNIPTTYYPEITWREMSQEFPYYMGVSKTTPDYEDVEQQYFRTLYGDRPRQLEQQGITWFKSQLDRFTPTSQTIFHTKEKKGLEWLVNGVVDQHKQWRGIPKGLVQPPGRRQPVQEKSDDEQTKTNQHLPIIIQQEEVCNPPSPTETNSSDTQPQPQPQPLARDLSWTTVSSGYPESSPESLVYDCEVERMLTPPRIIVPGPDLDLINQSNVGTQIEEKTRGNQPESAEYFPKDSPDVEISDTELMERNWPVSTPETQTDGELMLPNSQYPTRSMSNLPAFVQPISLRERKSSEIDLSALSPALTLTPPKSSRNTATLLGIGISQQKDKQQQTATPVPKFSVNADADQQQLNKQFAKKLAKQNQQKRLNKQVAKQQEQQQRRKQEQERREEEMQKREQERRNEEMQKIEYHNNLRKAEEQKKFVQLRDQMIDDRQQQILGRNQQLLQWAREIEYQQTQLQAVEQQQSQMLQQQFNQMNLNQGAPRMNQATQLQLNQLLLTVQNEKIKQQARVQRFSKYQVEVIQEQRKQQQIALQL